MADALAVQEEKELAHFEAIIEQGRQTFIKVGSALENIRERELFKRAGFDSYTAYLAGRWGWTNRHANRQIAAAKVATELADALGEAGPNGPTTEAQARAVGEVVPEKRVEVWTAASVVSDGKPPTAETVRTVAAVIPGAKPKRSAAVEKRNKEKAAERAAKEAAAPGGVARWMPGQPPKLESGADKEAPEPAEQSDGGSTGESVIIRVTPEVGETPTGATASEDEPGAAQDGSKSTQEDGAREAQESPADRYLDVPPVTSAVVEVSVALEVLRHISGFGPVRSLPSPTSADLLALDDADAEDLLLLSMWLKQAHTRRKNLLEAKSEAA